MDYIEINITIKAFSEEIAEILTAELAEVGFDSFEETPEGLKAYVPEKTFDLELVKNILQSDRFPSITISYAVQTIVAQNWNALWESNFEPITVNDKLLVKAPFHNIAESYPFTITIEPKMSFGTGHHETTSLILEQMFDFDFSGETLLDMGCGTGILAIFARMRGAANITAIDFDEWAYENSLENVKRNNCEQIQVLLGDASVIPNKTFDTIIANINRNVLLNDINIYAKQLKKSGRLFLSGFYTTDIEAIESECNKNGLVLNKWKEKKNWAACIFSKE